MTGAYLAPLVSVVIPTYHRSHLVVEAVRSALDQTLTNIEVLVMDDASDDDTLSNLAALGDERVRAWALNDHSGHPGVVRNAALSHARAPWLAFLDSDDRWFPGHLWSAVRWLTVEGEQIVALAPLDDPHIRVENSGDGYLGRATAANLVEDNRITTSGVVLSRSLLAEVGGFPERDGVYEDLALWLRIATLVPIPLRASGSLEYRQRADSHSLELDSDHARYATIVDFLYWLRARSSNG